MSKYYSKSSQSLDFIKNYIIPAVNSGKEIDYNKCVVYQALRFRVSPNKIKQNLELFKDSGELDIIQEEDKTFIVMTKERLGEYLKNLDEAKKQAEQDFKEVGL